MQWEGLNQNTWREKLIKIMKHLSMVKSKGSMPWAVSSVTGLWAAVPKFKGITKLPQFQLRFKCWRNSAIPGNGVPYANWNGWLSSPGISSGLTLQHSLQSHLETAVLMSSNIPDFLRNILCAQSCCSEIQCDIFNVFWASVPERSFSFWK